MGAAPVIAAPAIAAPVIAAPAPAIAAGLQTLPNGAVVPKDTPSVLAARADHFAARGAAYAAAGPIVALLQLLLPQLLLLQPSLLQSSLLQPSPLQSSPLQLQSLLLHQP